MAELKDQSYFDDLMVAFNRCFNLSSKGGDRPVRPELFEDQAEQDVYEMAEGLDQELTCYLSQGEYFSYCEKLATMRPCLDTFFERIMVMVEDESTRETDWRY